MPAAYPAPDPIQSQFFVPVTNLPGNGVKLFCYLNFTTVKQAVYQDSNQTTAFPNPIILDADGNLPFGGEVYIGSGKTMTFVYAPADDTDPPTNPYKQFNDIQGVNDPLVVATSSALVSQWVTPTNEVAFVSPSSFIFSGDWTGADQADPGRRIQAQISAGTAYGYIHDATFSGGSTVINIIPDLGQVLDAGLFSVQWGLLSAANPSVPYGISHGAEVQIAARVSTGIFSSGIAENILLTSTAVSVAAFDATVAGEIRYVRVSTGPLTLVHNTSRIIVPTGSTITMQQNDSFTALALGSSVTFIKDYHRFSGAPLGPQAPALLAVTSYPTATSAAVIPFSGAPFNAYNDIVIKCRGLFHTSTGDFSQAQVVGTVSQNNGSTFITSAINSFAWEALGLGYTVPFGGGSTVIQQITTQAFIALTPVNTSATTGLSSSNQGGADLDFSFVNFMGASTNTFMPRMNWEGSAVMVSTGVMPVQRIKGLAAFTNSTTGLPATTGQLNAIRLQVSTATASTLPMTIRRVEIWGY